MSLADDIFSEQDASGLRNKPFTAWGKPVYVFELTAAESDEFEAGRVKQQGKKMVLDFRGSKAKLVALCLRTGPEQDAPRVFSDDQVKRLQKIGRKELDRVYDECAAFNGITAGDDEDESPAAKN